MNSKHLLSATIVSIAIALSASTAAAQQAAAVATPGAGATVTTRKYEDLYERYLASARKTQARPQLWMADLAIDPKARRLNDLVTVSVIENLSATGSADSNVDKSSKADVVIPGTQIADQLARLFRIPARPRTKALAPRPEAHNSPATVTARVVEVLPNGDLVIEGVREVDINGDRSLVILTGVVRQFDVQSGNVVSSAPHRTAADPLAQSGTHQGQPDAGWLIRALNKGLLGDSHVQLQCHASMCAAGCSGAARGGR
jgi:flagellar L-ring protein precursor FlgH